MQFHDRVLALNDISHDLSTLPSGDTGSRLTSLLAAINANNRAAAMDFLAANLALPPSAAVGIEDYAEWMLSFYRGTQGVVLRGIEPANRQTSHLVLIVEDRLYSAWHRIRVHFERDGLGPIIAIGAGPADSGDNGAITKGEYVRLARTLCERGPKPPCFLAQYWSQAAMTCFSNTRAGNLTNGVERQTTPKRNSISDPRTRCLLPLPSRNSSSRGA